MLILCNYKCDNDAKLHQISGYAWLGLLSNQFPLRTAQMTNYYELNDPSKLILPHT